MIYKIVLFSATQQLKSVNPNIYRGFPGGSTVKNAPATQEMQATWVQSLSWEGPLEERNWHPTPVFLPGKLMGRGAMGSQSQTPLK